MKISDFKSWATGMLLATALTAQAQGVPEMGGHPFDQVAPYLLQSGMYDVVNRYMSDRDDFDRASDIWNALWIEHPGAAATDYGVYYFRKDVELASVPGEYKIHITADQRYKLFVNGQLVSVGPARSVDVAHWNYATLDLKSYLKTGKNVVVAQVWNMGKYTPLSEMTLHGGLLVSGEGEAKALTTNNTWKSVQDESYQPKAVVVPGYYAADASDQVDMNKQVKGVMDPDNDLSTWKDARPFALAYPTGTNSGTGGYTEFHLLQPSILPQMELAETRLKEVRLNGGLKVPAGFLTKPTDWVIPARQKVDILLDNGVLTNAYAHLLFSKGKNAVVELTFSEALYEDEAATKKGNRNDVDGKFYKGRIDQVTSNGEDNQQFTTLSWRTYRYVKLHIETQDEPLTLNDIYGTFVGYPFQLNAHIDTDNREIQQMMEIGWRTARLCAIETYFDCPFYEQLMYLGDTRIQALITLYNSGDDRMVKNYLTQSDLSRTAEGITAARTPVAGSRQLITPYALCYIYAIHDYLRYGNDEAFVESLIPGAEQILAYFGRYQQVDGRIRKLPGWNFSDWVYTDGWNTGVAERGADGCSILMDLQLLYAYQMMSDLEKHFGNESNAAKYQQRAEQLKTAIHQAYWDNSRGLYADRTEKDRFSQHANSLAILCGMTDAATARSMAQKMLEDKTLAQCSVYYKYYLHEALIKAGLADDYMKWLDIWRENIRMGMTTWAEISELENARSECHAWGASPNIEFFRTLLGIDSASAGFKTVKIEPHLGDIQKIGGTMPHPQGKISVAYQQTKKGMKATISLPAQVTGTFVWQGKAVELKGGENKIEL